MRGKLFGCAAVIISSRITPAGAGKTYIKSQPDVRIKDHPRRCGENSPPAQRWEQPVGSPPQVRGKPECLFASCVLHRITPAGAGKTCGVALPYDFKPDHPRRCGENCAWSLQTLTAIGSPPQVRGKPIIILHSIAYARITPAGAGKTSERAVPTPEHGDHPRRCGENLLH